MSYDIYTVKAKDIASAVDIVNRQSEAEETEVNPGPISEAVEQQKRHLADALRRVHPALGEFNFDYATLAQSSGIDAAEARRRFRLIELTDDKLGLQITIFDDHATATLAYWHKGKAARTAFDALFECVGVLCREAGYSAYDPQLDCLLDLSSDKVEAISLYECTKAAAEKVISKNFKKPWWKFW